MLRILLIPALFFSVITNTGPAYAQPTDESPLMGINPGGVVDWSTAWVFVDVFRHARQWIPQQVSGGPWDTGEHLDVDANGWIASLEPGQAAATLMVRDTGGRYPAGEYLCLYEGEGTIEFGFDARVVSSSPGRIVLNVNPSNGGIYLKIVETSPANPIRNIRVIMPGFHDTYLTQVFHPDYLDSLQPYEVIRFMDWMHTNGSDNDTWDNRTTPDTFSQAGSRGVAVEYMIDLCNRIQAHPWFCMPHRADDTFIRRFAETVRDHLNPSQRVYIEHSNEVWNGQFEQATFAREQGLALGLSDNDYQAQLFYHSRRSVEIFSIWEDVFGGTERLVRVLSAQSANPWTGEQVMTFDDAYRHADALAVAPYFGGYLGSGDAAEAAVTMNVDEILDACHEDILSIRETTRTNAANAESHGLELIAYEGGQHLVGVGSWVNNKDLEALFQAANRHPRMRDLYYQDLTGWQEAGGGLFAAFSHIGQYSKWGSWGILEYQQQPRDTAGKWLGIQEYIESNSQMVKNSRLHH